MNIKTKLPPHLQSVIDKLKENTEKLGFTIEEIDCEEIFNKKKDKK